MNSQPHPATQETFTPYQESRSSPFQTFVREIHDQAERTRGILRWREAVCEHCTPTSAEECEYAEAHADPQMNEQVADWKKDVCSICTPATAIGCWRRSTHGGQNDPNSLAS